MFKFERLTRRPSVGTVDDIRTFGAPQGNLDPPERYPPDGVFNNVIAVPIPAPMAQRFRLGSVTFNAGLPVERGTLDGIFTNASGQGTVTVSAVGGGATLSTLDGQASFGLGGAPFDPATPGLPYTVSIEAADFGDGPSSTPYLDDITLRYLGDIRIYEVLPRVEP